MYYATMCCARCGLPGSESGGREFFWTDLSESLFGETDLTGADFREVRNYRIDPRRNTLAGARFSLPEALALLYALDIEIGGEGE